MWRRGTRGRHRQRGAAVVETAFVLLFVMAIFMGIFDFGHYLMARHMVTSAAREGARRAVVGMSSDSEAEIRSYVLDRLGGQFATGATVRIYHSDTDGNELGPWNETGFGDCITVDVRTGIRTFTPKLVFLPSFVSIHARSVVRGEGN